MSRGRRRWDIVSPTSRGTNHSFYSCSTCKRAFACRTSMCSVNPGVVCHTDYTMYGGLRSKMRGLRHIYVQYLGSVPEPKNIKLYQAYDNNVCLHCHLDARSFEEHERHRKTSEMMGDIKSNKISCMTSNCHDIVHDVDTLKDASFWKGGS